MGKSGSALEALPTSCLSLANVAKTMEVIFDSSNGNQFEVTKADGKKRIFKQSEHGLYYYDMRTV
jgi:hypothetical protein